MIDNNTNIKCGKPSFGEWRKGEIVGCWLLRLSLILVLAILGFIVYYIVEGGLSVISFEFLTTVPRSGMTEGGILPAIIGTFYVTLITIAFSVPLGIVTGCITIRPSSIVR